MISKQLLKTINNIYEPLDFQVTFPPMEGIRNQEYSAAYFGVNGLNIVYREAKITPKKIGQFVAVWKKKKGINAPYDSTDNIDILIINVCQKDNIGQFIFDKEILIKKKILTHEEILGKMAFRVYPPWSKPISKQAITTQKWQLKYYVSLTDTSENNILKMKELLKK